MIGLFKKIIVPVRFKSFYSEFKSRKFRLLDVGCGNHWPSKTKKWFRQCLYHGLDQKLYNNDERDLQAMEQFYSVDLAQDKLNDVPDNYFDVIMLVHVIEHLPNGLELVSELTKKLKENGLIYIEYPSVKSLSLPNMRGTLNFCDDETHIKLYDLKEICNKLLALNFKIIRAGARRDPLRIIMTPINLLLTRLRGQSYASALCDISGFAEYIYAEKRKEVKRINH